jgi:hypothetical protein
VSSAISENNSFNEFEDIKQTGSDILKTVDDVLVYLQFRDRVDQILGHVVNSTGQMVKQVTQRMKMVKLTVCPTSLISSTCREISKQPIQQRKST